MERYRSVGKSAENLKKMKQMNKLVFAAILLISTSLIDCKKHEGEKPEWAKKDIRDFTDADMERLYDQWEV